MRLRYTGEQEALARQLRAYFTELMTPERRAALQSTREGDYGDGTAYRETIRQLGADGWLALGWPPEYGGTPRTSRYSAARSPVASGPIR